VVATKVANETYSESTQEPFSDDYVLSPLKTLASKFFCSGTELSVATIVAAETFSI